MRDSKSDEECFVRHPMANFTTVIESGLAVMYSGSCVGHDRAGDQLLLLGCAGHSIVTLFAHSTEDLQKFPSLSSRFQRTLQP